MSQLATSLTPSVLSNRRVDTSGNGGRMLGLAIAALLPGLFWTAVVYAAASSAGYAPSPYAALSFMGLVTGFLAAVVSALQTRI